MTFTSFIPVRSGKRSVKINNPLDSRKVRTYGNNDHRYPDKSGNTAKNQDKKRFGSAEKSYAFKRIINFTFYFFPVTNLCVDHRFYERVHQ